MKFYNDDCLKVLPNLPENSVDLIITSPPYEDVSGAGYTSNSKDILFFKLYSDFIDSVFNQYYRMVFCCCIDHSFLSYLYLLMVYNLPAFDME